MRLSNAINDQCSKIEKASQVIKPMISISLILFTSLQYVHTVSVTADEQSNKTAYTLRLSLPGQVPLMLIRTNTKILMHETVSHIFLRVLTTQKFATKLFSACYCSWVRQIKKKLSTVLYYLVLPVSFSLPRCGYRISSSKLDSICIIVRSLQMLEFLTSLIYIQMHKLHIVHNRICG